MAVRRLFVLFSSLSLLFSCIDRIDLPIRTEEPRLVVEGQITSDAPPYAVRLTYTGAYGGASGENPASQFVRGAQLRLADDQGRSTAFAETSPGVYQTTDSLFRGQVGRAYSLTIALRTGKRYLTQPERMPDVPLIDSVAAGLVRVENIATPFRYAYAITTNDPGNQKNYYRWTAYGITSRRSQGVPCCSFCPSVCFDRCWITVSTSDVNIYSDDAINGNPIQHRQVLQLPVYTVGPQLVEVQQYGITQANYQFWKLYQQQFSRTGSIFDPLPAPIVGNVVNADDATDRARGYFAVASVTRKRFRNQAEASASTAVYGFISSQIIPPGDCRATYGPVPVYEPAGWR